jgi:hypothetical protein
MPIMIAARGFLVASALLLLAAGGSVASEEGALMWSSFTVRSGGIGTSGPVTVSGTQGGNGITAMEIDAFGRKVVLDDVHLQRLKGVTMNGMQLSYENGYEQLGGRTLYIQLSLGFTSGTPVRKVLVVHERGDGAMLEPPDR